ncbi:MAG: chorismate-binding protein, partial [Muribaculaceae bacterium]|nr:chorismate-binding protein [Muribaculaceae bacterium]
MSKPEGDNLKGAWLAAYYALQRGVSFALYVLPNRKRANFICDIEGRPAVSDRTFSIVPWRGAFKDRVIIRDTIGASEFIAHLPEESQGRQPDYTPWDHSTDKLVYKGQVVSAIDLLTEIGLGKIVLSRTKYTDCSARKDLYFAYVYALQQMCDFCPETLRYIYFTPETGCWMAATPELLLNYNREGGFSHTMALAGTRKRTYSDDLDNWDEKNQYEHNIVADVILDSLEHLGVKSIEERENMIKTGSVEHLCHDIRFKAEGVSAEKILDTLSPTPALGGFPREIALQFLDYYELHPRRCYGGYVVIDDKDLLAYVNLRCANV